jgi:lysophospholipase L1-like esterase
MAANGGSRPNFAAMEMESNGRSSRRDMKPMPVQSSSGSTSHPLDQLCMFLKLHMEYYPRLATALVLSIIGLLFYMFVKSFQTPMYRNRLSHDYTKIELDYNFKASQLDHWCLFGGDDACQCEDFTETISREEQQGWLPAHEANKKRIQQNVDYDVVFFGDETTEEWNGYWYNKPSQDGHLIRKYWNETFTSAAGGELEGLALGIAGDSTANLLWRMQHGELPQSLNSKVFWLLIGTNDLSRGGCSEEATVLGILRTVEEIAFSNPGSVVVIQGILPRSSRQNGSLEKVGGRAHHLFEWHHSETFKANQARRHFLLWPSIQKINQQLATFCKEHDHLVYFDVDSLFLGTLGNDHYTAKSQQIVSDLMPDYVHLSVEGHRVLGNAILRELQRIIFEDDERNDVE